MLEIIDFLDNGEEIGRREGIIPNLQSILCSLHFMREYIGINFLSIRSIRHSVLVHGG